MGCRGNEIARFILTIVTTCSDAESFNALFWLHSAHILGAIGGSAFDVLRLTYKQPILALISAKIASILSCDPDVKLLLRGHNTIKNHTVSQVFTVRLRQMSKIDPSFIFITKRFDSPNGLSRTLSGAIESI